LSGRRRARPRVIFNKNKDLGGPTAIAGRKKKKRESTRSRTLQEKKKMDKRLDLRRKGGNKSFLKKKVVNRDPAPRKEKTGVFIKKEGSAAAIFGSATSV